MAITPALYPIRLPVAQSYRQRVRAYINGDVLDISAGVYDDNDSRLLMPFDIEEVTPTELLPVGFTLPTGEALTVEGARYTFDLYAPASRVALLTQNGVWRLSVADKVAPFDSALLMYGPATLEY